MAFYSSTTGQTTLLSFYSREELCNFKRITLLRDYIREVTEQNQDLLMGECREMLFAD